MAVDGTLPLPPPPPLPPSPPSPPGKPFQRKTKFRLDDEIHSLPHRMKKEHPKELSFHAYGFFGEAMMAANFKFLREMKKVGQKVDRSEWFMTPETVNAYYAPFWNEMVFPAAILQPPFFHISHHPAQNFGAIGGIMGHELSHGFDTHGHKYDKSGRLKMWWRRAARAEFLKRARCVVKYFQRYTVQGMQLSGLKELAENVADMGGVKFSLSALRLFLKEEAAAGRTYPVTPTHVHGAGEHRTVEQLFFLSWGQTWCTKASPDTELSLASTDEHSPARMRVNGPLSQNKDFQKAFGCAKGTPMNPSKGQCVVW